VGFWIWVGLWVLGIGLLVVSSVLCLVVWGLDRDDVNILGWCLMGVWLCLL